MAHAAARCGVQQSRAVGAAGSRRIVRVVASPVTDVERRLSTGVAATDLGGVAAMPKPATMAVREVSPMARRFTVVGMVPLFPPTVEAATFWRLRVS
ncbi:hypothetical protein GCM10010435_72320 [Winogradskya consettensis]|uniref:Uncharacterized protein n=1 Tax=Winogradskya consettensis TaxID=113560 RepID=A0A919VYT6_9ACTN|nr:hypothetical protein Aco04nite_87220 [Actinoplanes consettensis]